MAGRSRAEQGLALRPYGVQASARVEARDRDANTSTASAREAAAQFPDARFVDAGHTPTPEG